MGYCLSYYVGWLFSCFLWKKTQVVFKSQIQMYTEKCWIAKFKRFIKLLKLVDSRFNYLCHPWKTYLLNSFRWSMDLCPWSYQRYKGSNFNMAKIAFVIWLPLWQRSFKTTQYTNLKCINITFRKYSLRCICY